MALAPLKPMIRAARRPVVVWSSGVIALGAISLWLASGWSQLPAVVAVSPKVAVQAPMRPEVQLDEGRRLTVTLRWGHPAGPREGTATAGPAAQAWDGYLALDCGEISRVDPLELESDLGDRVGPVVRGEGGDERVYWRSKTSGDADGLQVQLVACAASAKGESSHLRIVTPQRTYSARLDWTVDDFVSLRAGDDGSTLDIHIASQRDIRAIRGARITAVPRADAAPVASAPPEGAPSPSVQ